MPLIKFQNLNKYGNWRTRIFYHPTTNYGLDPRGFGPAINVSLFKYKHNDLIPPHLFVSPVDGKKYILPTWQPVLPETTLKDIDWIKSKVKKEKELYKSWKIKSSNGIDEYKVVQKGINNFNCNCLGARIYGGRDCRHVKEVKNLLK